MQNLTIGGTILIAILLLIFACSNQKEKLKDFEYEQDFEKNNTLFSKDIFELNGQSTEGGEIFVFTSNKRQYKVYDVWLYNEMSKRNTIYFVDKSNTYKLVKQATYIYDKPIYIEGAKSQKLVQYFTYNNDDFKYFSNTKLEIIDKELKTKKRKELEQLFETVLQSSKNGVQKKNE